MKKVAAKLLCYDALQWSGKNIDEVKKFVSKKKLNIHKDGSLLFPKNDEIDFDLEQDKTFSTDPFDPTYKDEFISDSGVRYVNIWAVPLGYWILRSPTGFLIMESAKDLKTQYCEVIEQKE